VIAVMPRFEFLGSRVLLTEESRIFPYVCPELST